MALEILQGDYGLVTAPSLDSEVTGDGTAKIAQGKWVEVTALASGTGIFASGTAEKNRIKVGDLYYETNTAANATAPASSDKYRPLGDQVLTSAKSWSVEFTRNQIDVTTLRDPQSVNIFGRPTVAGTIGGLSLTGKPDDTDKEVDPTFAYSRFFETYEISNSNNTITILRQMKNTTPVNILCYTLKAAENKAYIEAFYMPLVDFGTISVGAEVGGLTEFSSPISLGSDSLARGIKRYLIDLGTA